MPRFKHAVPNYALPWERQPEESDPAFEAFRIYRDMPLGENPRPRSNREVARRLGKNDNLIHRWGRRHSWVTRCAAYDADLDRESRAIMRTQALAAVKQHAGLAGAAIGAIGMPLRALTKPQVLVGPDGTPRVNEDGDVLTRDRQADLEALSTPALLVLMRNVAALLPTVIAIRMDALGNPHEPLPELPEWGADEITTEVTTPDRMRDILLAAEESGVLRLAGASREAELDAEAAAEGMLADAGGEPNGHP